ncbi:tetratricopeptide repeat protein, partial [Desulfovibrio sp. OttesenSCG-928-G15]|nr:tetratricopeptide repeat protein [Desulfovibrio sp. OttesenSCG-928-G15]
MRGIRFSMVFMTLILGVGIFGLFAPYAQGASFTSLKAEFDGLVNDPARSGLRDSWLSLEKKFAQLEAQSSGEEAASAAFYHACSRQELGRRSFSSADHKEAVKLFAYTANKYPKSAVAPESLVRQGGILYRLGNKKAAVPILEKLVAEYPSSACTAEAKNMLDEYRKKSGAAPAAPAKTSVSDAAGGKTPAKSAAKDSVTLKNITWSKKGQRAVITLDLDNTASVAHNFLPPDTARKTPGRLYLDIAGALPHESLKTGASPKGLVVTGIRTGKTDGGTRVTLECDGVQCYVVRSPKGSPQIIQIEVSRKEDIKGGISVAKPAAAGAATGTSAASAPKKGTRPSSSVIEQLGLTVK